MVNFYSQMSNVNLYSALKLKVSNAVVICHSCRH